MIPAGRQRRFLLWLLALSGAALVLAASIAHFRPGPETASTAEAEQRLRREARRERTPLREIQCVRAAGLPRSFDCFAEGNDDLHLVYHVVIRRDGSLEVRRP